MRAPTKNNPGQFLLETQTYHKQTKAQMTKKQAIPYSSVTVRGFPGSALPRWLTNDDFTDIEPKVGLPSMVGQK